MSLGYGVPTSRRGAVSSKRSGYPSILLRNTNPAKRPLFPVHLNLQKPLYFHHCWKVISPRKTLITQGDQKVSVHLPIKVQTLDELKMALTEHILNVDRAILNTAFENTVRRVSKCQETGRGHFEHYL